MMSQFNARRFDEAVSKYEGEKYSEAFEQFHALVLDLSDPWDKAEVLYHEVITLVVLTRISEARQRINELRRMVVELVKQPSDGSDYDLQMSLPVMVRHAEIRVLVEEGNSPEALTLLDDLRSHYPKQLCIPQFRTVSTELDALRGMLLGDVGRWTEAKALLESALPPKCWQGVHTYYLGQCYYELGMDEKAKTEFEAALQFGLKNPWKSGAYFKLGLIAYKFSDITEAKNYFELCANIVDQEDFEMAKLWAWLEETSRALGQLDEAERYHKHMVASVTKRVN